MPTDIKAERFTVLWDVGNEIHLHVPLAVPAQWCAIKLFKCQRA